MFNTSRKLSQPCKASWPAVAGALCILVTAGLAIAEPITGSNLNDRAKYLCDWRLSHPENPTLLPYCDGKGDESRSYLNQLPMQDWWQWMFNHYEAKAIAMREAFDADWERERKPILDKEARARAKKIAAEKLRQHETAAAALIARIPSMPVFDLCTAARDGSEQASAELQRRKAFSKRDLDLIKSGRIGIGMSEAALECSWGRARVNRTVNASGEHKQYVYGDTFVYVEGSYVIAFQDRN